MDRKNQAIPGVTQGIQDHIRGLSFARLVYLTTQQNEAGKICTVLVSLHTGSANCFRIASVILDDEIGCMLSHFQTS